MAATCRFLSFFSVLIVALFVSASLFLPGGTKTSIRDHLSDVCRRALDSKSCQDSVFRAISGEPSPPDTATLHPKFLTRQVQEMRRVVLLIQKQGNDLGSDREQGALSDCTELLNISIDLVADSIEELEKENSRAHHANAQAWLSAVLTNHATCFDGLGFSGKRLVGKEVEELMGMARASLAMLAAVSVPEDDEVVKPLKGLLPTWISPVDRKLMEAEADSVKADLVVAKDGSGDFRTVAEAVDFAPENCRNRFVIRVKKGMYRENVEVGKKKKNLMIIGDGMGKTTISGRRNVDDGSTTFNSATLAAVGEGFILQDISIKNTAGPQKHQAVALRVGSDKSVINRCKIEAYQDTLYAHSLRQFYRNSTIKGTVDFIFGDAAVVFQKCRLLARKPMAGQKNMVTAQGRRDPNQNTGTSIQHCEIKPSKDLEPVKSSFPTYLGRPWKEFSRTVVMESYIADHVDPAGWSEWSGGFALDTLYYGEYKNKGPGAHTEKRVNWTGYHLIMHSKEAMNFTVKELIQGGDWLQETGVPYTEGL